MRHHLARIISSKQSKGLYGLFLLCALTLVLAACGGNQTTQQQSTPVALPPLPPIGGLPPGLTGVQPSGQVDPNLRLQLTIGLATNRQALADELAALYDPNSSEFGRYLTPQELASRYGASQANVDKVTSYLQAQGFQILSVSPLRNQISVSATVAQVAQTLGVTLLTFPKNGQTVFSPSSTITLPAALKSLVTSVVGCDQRAGDSRRAKLRWHSGQRTNPQANCRCL